MFGLTMFMDFSPSRFSKQRDRYLVRPLRNERGATSRPLSLTTLAHATITRKEKQSLSVKM
jgi:hypothetical protein